jgi:hypothetical protein
MVKEAEHLAWRPWTRSRRPRSPPTSTKLAGGHWARGRLDDPSVVDAVIARQSGGRSMGPPDPPFPPDAAALLALLDLVVARLGS